jgi:hypothetical protein
MVRGGVPLSVAHCDALADTLLCWDTEGLFEDDELGVSRAEVEMLREKDGEAEREAEPDADASNELDEDAALEGLKLALGVLDGEAPSESVCKPDIDGARVSRALALSDLELDELPVEVKVAQLEPLALALFERLMHAPEGVATLVEDADSDETSVADRLDRGEMEVLASGEAELLALGESEATLVREVQTLGVYVADTERE